MARVPLIDTHVHFWDMRSPLPGLAWHWLARDADHSVIGDIDAIKSVKYDVTALWGEARFADVAGFVHVQAAIGSDDPVLETEWLTRMRREAPAPFTIVAHADLGTPDGAGQIERHAWSPYFVGVRDFAAERWLAAGDDNAVYEASLRELARRGLVFDLDCEWMNMAAAARLAGRHPDLAVVLEHIGFPRARDDAYFADWSRAVRGLATADNVTCKISGVGMSDPRFTPESLRRWVDTCLDAFGPDRCVLGSNWPVDRLFSGYERIMDTYRGCLGELTAGEREKILRGNAARLYRL
jgi:predicted TIM-barrel fold metal-dependent hydrolase